jgi:MFS family permease
VTLWTRLGKSVTQSTTDIRSADDIRRTTARPETSAPWPTLAVLALATTSVAIQQTLVLPLLAQLQVTFHTSLASAAWAFTATLLSAAVSTPLAGRFGDLYGKRRVMVMCLVLLVIGCGVAAVADSVGVLIAGRALQGLSVGVIPLAIGIVRDVFPSPKVAAGIAVISAMMVVAGGLGMIITGSIAEVTTNPRPVFWVGFAAAAVALPLVVVLVPRSAAASAGRPDLVGAVLLAACLVCLLLATNEGPTWGWTSTAVLALLAAAAILGVAWFAAQLRVAEPLVNVRLLARPGPLGANIGALVLGFVLFGHLALLARLAQAPTSTGYGLGASVVRTGLLLLPFTAFSLGGSLVVGRLIARFGSASVIVAGSLVAAAGVLWPAFSVTGTADLLGSTAVLGIGIGLAYAAVGTMAIEHVPLTETGMASGMNTLARSLGGSVSGVVTTALLTASPIPGTDFPSLRGYVLYFFVAAAGCVVAAVCAALFGRAASRGGAVATGLPGGRR